MWWMRVNVHVNFSECSSERLVNKNETFALVYLMDDGLYGTNGRYDNADAEAEAEKSVTPFDRMQVISCFKFVFDKVLHSIRFRES